MEDEKVQLVVKSSEDDDNPGGYGAMEVASDPEGNQNTAGSQETSLELKGSEQYQNIAQHQRTCSCPQDILKCECPGATSSSQCPGNNETNGITSTHGQITRLRVQLEGWSRYKTVALGAFLVAFAIWVVLISVLVSKNRL